MNSTDPIAAVSSPDHNAERLAALKQLFPDLFTNEGRLNVDELKKVVDPKLVSETERYDFRWYGKTASKREAFTPSRAALVCDQARSVNPAKAGGNMIIEGENLEVLKLLSSAYRERIKCIYIDPPYNTGKDFVYSDRFTEGQKPYWAQTGVTEDGVKVDTNTDSDGRFHSNWLSMMHSRLLVARYLLSKDGVILVSIDDDEHPNLRRLLDEVFGPENFIANLVWEKGRKNDAKFVSVGHEYIIVYARDLLHLKELGTQWREEKPGADKIQEEYVRLRSVHGQDDKLVERDLKAFYEGLPKGHPSKKLSRYGRVDAKGVWRDDNMSWPGGGGPSYDVLHPVTGQPCAVPPGGWRFSKPEKMAEMIKKGRVEFRADHSEPPIRKTYLVRSDDDIEEEEIAEDDDVGIQVAGSYFYRSALPASNLLADLFDGRVFENPKDHEVLGRWIRYVSNDKNSLILDFFGGSGTTAQAVMELNKADGGNRQFILVQLPELTAADSPAHKAGFKKISDITIERAKRVIARIQKEAEGLLPNDPQREFADGLGFKVFKLAKSNFPRVEFAPDPDKTEAENIELLKQYIRDKEATFHIQWERETVLDEVLLKNGFMLDYTLTPRPEFTKNEVFLAKDAHKESLICLDVTLAPETVDHFKQHPEHFFICLELALDTTKKWNLKHHLGDKLKAF
jgi:adenine-specific DNA-methyltransferase